MAKGNMGLAGKLAAGIAAGVTILSLYSGIAKAQETEASNAASETISFSIMPSDTSSLDSFVSNLSFDTEVTRIYGTLVSSYVKYSQAETETAPQIEIETEKEIPETSPISVPSMPIVPEPEYIPEFKEKEISPAPVSIFPEKKTFVDKTRFSLPLKIPGLMFQLETRSINLEKLLRSKPAVKTAKETKTIYVPIQKPESNIENYGKFETGVAVLSPEDIFKAFNFSSDESRVLFLKKMPRHPLAQKAASELKERDMDFRNREIKNLYFDDSEGFWIVEASPWFQYKYGFKKPKHSKGPTESGKKSAYYCARFVQQTFYSNFSEEECRKLGIEGHVWMMIDFLKEKKEIIYEREVKSSVLCKNLRKEYPNKEYSEILKMMAEERKKTEDEVRAMLRPGDIIIAWNPYSLYKKHLVTHSAIYLGDGYIMQDWKKKLEIMTLDELYRRIPGRIDFIGRPDLAKTYKKIILRDFENK